MTSGRKREEELTYPHHGVVANIDFVRLVLSSCHAHLYNIVVSIFFCIIPRQALHIPYYNLVGSNVFSIICM